MAEDGIHQAGDQDFWSQFDAIKQVRAYPEGGLIFAQDSVSQGVYLVHSGLVRIRMTGTAGAQTLAQAGSGTVLGLSECVAAGLHKVTAEAVAPAEVTFIEGHKFLKHLHECPGACMQIVRLLSEDLHALYHEFRSSGGRAGRPRPRAGDGG